MIYFKGSVQVVTFESIFVDIKAKEVVIFLKIYSKGSVQVVTFQYIFCIKGSII